AFLDAFFANDRPAATQLRDLIRRAPQLRGMAQIPLLLGFLSALHNEEQQKTPDGRRDLSRLRRGDLYEACLRRLLSGRWRDAPRVLTDGEVDGKLELLEQVAFRLFLDEKEMFSLRELRQAIREAYLGLYRSPLGEKEVNARIHEWSEQDGLLVKAGAGAN